MTAKGSLRTRVRIAFVLAALVPTALVGAMATWRAYGNVAREADAGARAQIRAIGAALDSELQGARRTVELAATMWAETTEQAPADAARRLRLLRRAVPMLATVTVTSPSGAYLWGDALTAAVPTGVDSFGAYISDVIDQRVYLVVQARRRTGELQGQLVCALDVGFIQQRLAAARVGQAAQLIVIDGTGAVVATHGAARPPELRHVSALARQRFEEGTVETHGLLTSYRNLRGFASMRGVNWAMLHQQPAVAAYRLAWAAALDTFLVACLAALVAALAANWFAMRLIRPLVALAARADAIAQGQGQRRLPPVRAPGEIGQLAIRIEEMAERITERAALQAALARGDRLASVGVMSAQLAHEINNPLTTVLGYARLLGEDKPADHPDRRGLELIASEAERMKRTIGALLSYARAGSPPELAPPTGPTRCRLADVVRQACSLVEPLYAKGQLTLRTHIPESLDVLIEGRALEQVLVNLLHNALHATQGRGEIAILGGQHPGGVGAWMVVADSGPGIAPADAARVFDLFYTTKSQGTGTGLGLAVCRHLITAAGGTLELSSGATPAPESANLPHGARFVIVLPVAT